MKYYIPGIIITMMGLAAAFACAFIASQQDSNIKAMVFMALGLGIFAVCSGFDSDTRISHHKRILKKAGLWTDQEIKKKDLLPTPKDPDE